MHEITVLIPGGFKPITAGHINLINKYLFNKNVKNIVLFVGYDIRDNIKREDSIYIINEIFKNDRISIFESNTKSPVLQCYEYMEKQTSGYYTLGASNKDDIKRIPNFIEKHKKGGKFNHDNINACYLDIDNTPYKISNKIISASDIRQYIISRDYKSFYNSYDNLEEDKIKFIYNHLKNKVCQLVEVI